VLVALFSIWSWLASREVRFWYDELLELSAARASTVREVLSFLRAGVDYNPPLSHFLIRVTTSLFGESEWAARLPAFLGMVMLLICVYLFVSRWMNRAYGLLATLVLLCLPIRQYAVQARPYGLVLGFSALTILLYQQAVHSRTRILALAGIGICTACLVATHYYAALVIGAILPVERIRTRTSTSPDWVLLSCIAGPPIVVLAMLWGIISSQRHQLTNYFSRGNLLSFDHGYDILDLDPLVYCLALVLISLLFWLRRTRATSRPIVDFPEEAGTPESLLGASLLLLPILGAFCTQFVTHAYVTRYFLPAAIGFSICVCLGVRFLSVMLPGLAVLLILLLSLGFGKALMQQAHRPPGALPPAESLDVATGPILFDTPASYMEVYHYFPSLRDKIWVISDPAAQMYYRKYDTDDKIMLALASMGGGRAITLKAAAHQWSHFSLIPRAGDNVWALKCVIDAEAQVKVTRPFTDLNFVFDVTLSPESIPRIDACGAGPR
jgi:4-amino-4-deoxy-L-arabinose transferase-like glycosyltransferase